MGQALQWADIHPTWGGSAIHTSPAQSDFVSPNPLLVSSWGCSSLLVCCSFAGHDCCPSVSPWSRLGETSSVCPPCISPFFSCFVVAVISLLEINILQVTNLSSIIWRQIFHLDLLRMSKRSSKSSMCWGEGASLHVTEFLGATLTHSHFGRISID